MFQIIHYKINKASGSKCCLLIWSCPLVMKPKQHNQFRCGVIDLQFCQLFGTDMRRKFTTVTGYLWAPHYLKSVCDLHEVLHMSF